MLLKLLLKLLYIFGTISTLRVVKSKNSTYSKISRSSKPRGQWRNGLPDQGNYKYFNISCEELPCSGLLLSEICYYRQNRVTLCKNYAQKY